MQHELTDSQFAVIARVAGERWGLHLTEQKTALVAGRLAKYLVRSPFESTEEFCRAIERNPSEHLLTEFFDMLSTNTTSFFRESHHFDYLAEHIYPALRQSNTRRLRIWSAACSNGAEPYTAVMHAMEQIPEISKWDFRVLATDLSAGVLAEAQAGVYPQEALQGIPNQYTDRYFEPAENGSRRVHRTVRSRVAVHELNLNGDWPMRGPFDVIFLRNVMIYFDIPTRRRLVSRALELLSQNGVLIVGSSETLTGVVPGIRALAPAIYAPEARRAAA